MNATCSLIGSIVKGFLILHEIQTACRRNHGRQFFILIQPKQGRKLEFEKGICHLGLSSASGEIAVFEYSVTAISRLRCATLEMTFFRQKNRTDCSVRCLLCWHYLSSRQVALQVLSARMSLTSVFGMGTGGPSSKSIPTVRVTQHDLVTRTGFEPMLKA